MEISNHWQNVISSLSRKMDYIDTFLQWNEIIGTMVFDDPLISQEEKEFIAANSKHSNWADILVYNGCGSGKRSSHFSGMNNQLHQFYHLTKFEMMSGKNIKDYDNVVEFGGGYGEMCRIAKSISNKINYTIIDLSILHQIQKYYLDGNKIEGYQQVEANNLPNITGKSVFIALWSLSEVPLDLRRDIFTYITNHKMDFFISFQTHYESYNNTDFFSNLHLDGYKITIENMGGRMNSSNYLLGEYNG